MGVSSRFMSEAVRRGRRSAREKKGERQTYCNKSRIANCEGVRRGEGAT